MNRKISRFKIGLFVLFCCGLIAGVLFWLGFSTYFEDTRTYVTYIDESVKGLQKDAVINYRGIAVGRVSSMGIAPDGRLVEIRLALQTDFTVADFMAVQLRSQGVTGLQYLEIDAAPENMDMLTPKIDFKPKFPVIPSIPSEIEQLKTALQTLYAKILKIDVDKPISAFTRAAESSAVLMERISELTGGKSLEESLENLRVTLESIRGITSTLDNQLTGLPPEALADLQSRMNKTVSLAQDLFSVLNLQVKESSVLMRQSLEQFNQLVNQLNTLVEQIRQQPSRLVLPSREEDPFEK